MKNPFLTPIYALLRRRWYRLVYAWMLGVKKDEAVFVYELMRLCGVTSPRGGGITDAQIQVAFVLASMDARKLLVSRVRRYHNGECTEYKELADVPSDAAVDELVVVYYPGPALLPIDPLWKRALKTLRNLHVTEKSAAR